MIILWSNKEKQVKDFIGVFDSGLGGVAVLADMHRLLPHENLIYLGDSKHAPYGEKTKQEITQLSHQIVQDFIDEGAKAILIACNTATSAAVDSLRETFSLPIIGMEPALKPALEQVPEGTILVLATTYTLLHGRYKRLLDELGQPDRFLGIAAPKLVRYVEQGIYDGDEIRHYLQEIVPDTSGIRAVVLGCTHFLYLKPAIRDFFGRDIPFFDANEGTIRHLERQIEARTDGEGTVEIRNSHSQEMVELSQCMMQKYLESATD